MAKKNKEIKAEEGTGKQVLEVEKIWMIGWISIGVAAIFMRFYDLGLKPFHHDEGVNGHFLMRLYNDGIYTYDPANYHGPTLYYISLLFSNIFGMESIPVRASMAVFGVAMVLVVFFLWRHIGRIGALSAGLFLAMSPGMVFISRYYIHEIFFVFLALAFAAAVVFFIEKEKAGYFAMGCFALLMLFCGFWPTLNLIVSITDNTAIYWISSLLIFAAFSGATYFLTELIMKWDNGRPIYMILASASAALMFATKETAFITLGTMLIAVFCIVIWKKIYKTPKETNVVHDELNEITADGLTWENFKLGLGNGSDRILLIAVTAFTFVYLNVVFFSSFFTYWEGLGKAVEAYAIWTKTGSRDHVSGTWAYVKWMREIELPMMLLASLGILIAIFKARHKFAMFAALWAFGLFLAYSIIPYKTPWLLLSFLLPMCIIAGYAINELSAIKGLGGRTTAIIVAGAAAAFMAYQSYDINFVRYDDNDVPYIYAHTSREYDEMIDNIKRYAAKSGKNEQTAVDVVSPEYWPMVWEMRDYKQTVFHGSMIPERGSEIVVARKGDQDMDIMRLYGKNYRFVRTYKLRPGVNLNLLVRMDIADPEDKSINQMR